MNIKVRKIISRAYPNQFWEERIENRWNYNDFLASPDWAGDWISFDGVVYHEASDRVFCGLTRFDGDILCAWNRDTEAFSWLGFDAVMDRYDAKFHRSMELSRDGKALYLATALLHDVDRYQEAPGGGVYRHDTSSGTTEKLGIPIPHNYIQSAVLDESRGALYCMHFTPEWLSVFDLETRKTREIGPLSGGMQMAQGENLVLDDSGCVWCSWTATKAWQSSIGTDAARLCKYDPAAGKIVYYDHGLPRPDGGHGFARVESLFNLGTGVLFASGANGSLYRIEPETGRAAYLGTPIADRPSRLTSLALHPDGHAYGITGRAGDCRLLKFDPRNETFELGDRIEADGETMFQCHDVTITPDGALFAGENDNPQRSGYLWEINL